MPVIYQKLICREDLKRNSNVLYLFGDNMARKGLGGQAKAMRGEPNAVGIRTKVSPDTDISAYWTDRTFERNTQNIDDDLRRVKDHLDNRGVIVIPADGIGTGLACMFQTCPQTFAYLQERLNSLEDK